jgi:uncharacterized protein
MANFNTREELIALLKAKKQELQQEWPIESMALFGSWARGEATPESDVDILISFDGHQHKVKDKRLGLFDYIGIKHQFEDMLGCSVDLVDRVAIKPILKPYILPEAQEF